jgi:poly-gamma-glutamate synthesis protein (capsule biosynthesis protein)
LGVLDGGDLMAHHLGGWPEVLPLADLARARGKFAVLTPRRAPSCRLAIAGDVVLAGDSGTATALLTELCGGAEVGLANLEGIPSNREPDLKPQFDFRFPKERLVSLRRAGIQALSLANNHAADAGLAGMVEGRAAVESAGIGAVGVGRNLAEALQPWRGEARGLHLVVFGVSVSAAPAATTDRPGVLRLPEHAVVFGQALDAARSDGTVVVVLVHWGDEYMTGPNHEQYEWARWFARHGVAVVAGSGPHVLQQCESHGGTTIAYSLGNALYPLVLRGRGSGAVWKLTIDANGSTSSQMQRVVP